MIRRTFLTISLLAVWMWWIPSMSSAVEKAAPSEKPASAAKPDDDAKLPRVLLIGDSISIGYTKPTIALMKDKANVKHHEGNAQDTRHGVKRIDAWLGDVKWDVIHFNWGLWDLRRDKGDLIVPLEEYERNLTQIVERLKKTNAKLIFATTTPVPEKNARNRRDADVEAYNAAAIAIMKKHGIAVNDLYSLAKRNIADWQKKDDVHFVDQGSQGLAEQVAKAVEAAMR